MSAKDSTTSTRRVDRVITRRRRKSTPGLLVCYPTPSQGAPMRFVPLDPPSLPLTIGRSRGCSLRLNDHETSRFHARFEADVVDDFALVRQAIERILEKNPAVFDGGPLMRARLMPALLTELGSSEHSAAEESGRENAWCCIDDTGMPLATRDVPEVDAAVVENELLRPFVRYCATCHLTAEQFPPNFLSGKANQVAENLRHCAPRMLVRLTAWRTPAKQRVKSPMPPETALPALGTTAQEWASSEEFEQLRAYVEKLARESDQQSAVSAAAGEAYEGLPSCLPSVH